METYRIKVIKVIGLATAFVIPFSLPLLGCGGWSEEAPPTLDIYLDRLPAKSLGQIFVETSQLPVATAPASIVDTIRNLIKRAKMEPASELIAEVDGVMMSVRAAGGNHEDLARLHDLRDALGAAPAQCGSYLEWRLDHTDVIKPVLEDDRYAYPPKPKPVPPSSLCSEIEKHAADPSDPMQPHWIYLRGAVAFNYGERVEAQKWFDRVVAEFPKHPRAEIALFMSARCLRSQSLESGSYDLSEAERARIEVRAKIKHGEAIERFRAYLALHPKGRFVADTHGWLGGLEEGVVALDHYIRQVETPGHPEVLKSGVFMIQKTLDGLSNEPSGMDAAIGLVAKHPRVAMGLLYQLLTGSASQYWSEEAAESQVVKNKKWRDEILPKLAAAVAARRELYAPEELWQPRYLTILAHAASNAGDHASAIELVGAGHKALKQNDDLLFTRAIVLQRAGKATEAIRAFQDFLQHLPESPLAKGARIRLAIALKDNHQAGEAVLELRKLVRPPGERTESFYRDGSYPPGDAEMKLTDSPLSPNLSNAETAQIDHVLDTILNYAPLQELMAVLEKEGLDPVVDLDLRAVIGQRALAQENFGIARKVLSPAQFELIAGKLEKLTIEVEKTRSSKRKAALQMELGDAWAAARGNLLKLPLDSLEAKAQLFYGDRFTPELHRRVNGRVLGFSNIEKELDERDELRHASRWWMRAAINARGTSLSASARVKALEAITKVARHSDYAFERAIEEEMGKASREIYDRLQAEAPRSKEARQAAYWSFERPAAGQQDEPGRYAFDDPWSRQQHRRTGYPLDSYRLGDGLENEDEYNQTQEERETWAAIRERVFALRKTKATIADLRAEIGELRGLAAAYYRSVSQAACLNFLEDLSVFLNQSEVTGEIAQSYIDLRLDVLNRSSWHGAPVVPKLVGIGLEGTELNEAIRARIAAALSDPGMQSVADYLEFLDAAMIANSRFAVFSSNKSYDKGEKLMVETRDYPSLEKKLRTFLRRYPHSQKREAARLLLARAVYRQSWPRFEEIDIAPGESVTETFQWEPLKPKRVFAELDAYEREFLNGRYAPEIRDMRAGVFWRSADWKPALEMTVRQLEEKVPDLQRDALFRLANIFGELSNPEHRPALIAAIRENPAALEWFKRYLAKAPNYRDHPLRFLRVYLEDQLGPVKITTQIGAKGAFWPKMALFRRPNPNSAVFITPFLAQKSSFYPHFSLP